MENRAHALAAGLFAIMLGAGIVFAIWWFSDQRVPMRELVLEARGDINGLGEQSRVRYRGMAAGRVRAIGIDPADLRTLLVSIVVPADLPLTQGTTATLGTLGVTGLAFVQLDDRGDDRRPLFAADGEAPRIALRAGLVEQLSGAHWPPSTNLRCSASAWRVSPTSARSSACRVCWPASSRPQRAWTAA